MSEFKNTFKYKLIYIFRINDDSHKNLLKIGETTCDSNKSISELFANSKELNTAAKNRIDSYTITAGIKYELLHTELAVHEVIKDDKKYIKAFSDHNVHNVLIRSGIKKHIFDSQRKANEWYATDLETAKKAIKAVKEGKSSLIANEITQNQNPIIFRPEQEKAIHNTIKQFKKCNEMLWNAKMRFGKTLTALQVAKEMNFERTIILTHRPVVSDGWFEDFNKIFYDRKDFDFGSKTKGKKIEELVDTDKKFVYFASIQDVRGSEAVGGKYEKNEFLFLIDWDFVVIDEAHEGTLTTLGKTTIEKICEQDNQPKILRLSGTPFNLLDKFKEDEIYTWDYVMEQREKANWDKFHFGDTNPYASLPEMKIYTYDLNKLITGYFDDEDHAFNFREFFRTWTGIVEKDFKQMPETAKVGDFVHEKDVIAFLNLLCNSDINSNYPFSTEKYREYFRHSLWMVPGVKEASALSNLLKTHKVFQHFNIVNVAGNGDEKSDYDNTVNGVRSAISDRPEDTYSITISCGRLTTGVTIPEWTAVFMLAGTFSTAASAYLQTIFRVQTPANINGKIKDICCVFDFAPDRTLKMVAEAGKLSAKSGDTSTDRKIMGEFLNFCPVIGIEGSKMSPFNVDSMLQQLKRAYTERVVKNGFDDIHIYNDNLLKLDKIELGEFENLKKIIGASKQTKKQNDIDINKQDLTNEKYEKLQGAEKTPPKQRTPEQVGLLEEKKKQRSQAETARSILRCISIRIPLLVYGANVTLDKEITTNNFTDLIDDVSWDEFMPKGVTKQIFEKFAKYYEQDVFIAAGRQIRNRALAADKLSPTERVKRIAEIFATFKNPDKETVLTPWRVVNMHIGDCLGGYDFFDDKHEKLLEEPRFVDKGNVTIETLGNINAKILEINSKSGLYPLYVAYSIYRKRCELINQAELTFEKQIEIWDKTVQENIFVICKTPMACAITKRTLLGYRKEKINAHAFDDLIMQIKDKPEQFVEKVTIGSFWGKEDKEMKFDAVVGNPPYQGNNHSQIYPYFYLSAIDIANNYVSLIFPTGWQLPKNANNLVKLNNEKIKTDKQIMFIDNKQNVFANIAGAEWVNIIMWQKGYDNQLDGNQLILTEGQNPQIKKLEWEIAVVKKPKEITELANIVVLSKNFVSQQTQMSKSKPYGLRTDVISDTEKYGLKPLQDEKLKNDDIKIYANKIVKYIPRDYNLPKKTKAIDKYKIFVPYAWGNMSEKSGLGGAYADVIIASPFEICTETYQESGNFNEFKTAQKHAKYLLTKFVRALLYYNKTSQHSTNAWGAVPIQDYSESWWEKSISGIDKELALKYNIPNDIVQYIEKNIQTKTEGNIINYFFETEE